MSEYLELPDGTKIDKATGEVVIEEVEFVEVPTDSEAVALVNNVRRRLSDLPDVPKKMNVVGVVLMYDMFGLADYEIAIATDLTVQQIENIKESTAYEEMSEALQENLRTRTQDTVRDILDTAAVDAAKNMVTAAKQGPTPLGLTASKDILDRSGHRPADVVEHKHKHEGGLNIRYIDASKDQIPDVQVIEHDE